MVVLSRVGPISMLWFVTLLSGCFSPALDGRFRCGDGGACPPGLRCAADGVCRDEARDAASALDIGATSSDLAVLHDLSTPIDLASGCVKKTCGASSCGNELDGCGGMLSCGQCPNAGPGQTCGGGGPNLCGTMPCMPMMCPMQGAACGFVSDGCSKVLNCGMCKNGQTCGTDHTCG